MGIEILITGLCIINLGAANGPALECPIVTNPQHELRVLVEAVEGAEWTGFPDGNTIEWSSGLDGLEMFVLKGEEIESITFSPSTLPPLNLAVGSVMRPDFIGLGYKKSASTDYFSMPLSNGLVEGAHWIRERGSGHSKCYKRANDPKQWFFQEHVRWTIPTVDKVVISLTGNRRVEVRTDHDGIKMLISNDVAQVSGGNLINNDEFKHWAGAPGMSGPYDNPDRCLGQVTRFPICNVMVVE